MKRKLQIIISASAVSVLAFSALAQDPPIPKAAGPNYAHDGISCAQRENRLNDAAKSSDIIGIFTTPVLWGGSDFGYWDNLVYNQTVPQDTNVKIGVRVGKTVAEVMGSAWMHFEYQGTSITQDLAHFNTRGSYIQVQVSMRTTIANVTPKVSNLTLSYQTKYAVYLFSRTFTLDPLTNLKSGLVTANVAVPPNTEVRFGITGKNSSEWNDYTLINLDKSFTLPASIKNQFKVGVKMMASSVATSGTIDGIALMLSGDIDNEINQLYQSSSSSSSSSS